MSISVSWHPWPTNIRLDELSLSRFLEIQDGGLVVAILNSGNQPKSVNVGQRRPTAGSVLSVKSSSGSRWNRVASSLRSIDIYTSGFAGRNFEFGSWPT